MIPIGWALLLGTVGGIVGAVIGMTFVAFLMGRWMKGQEAQRAAERVLRGIRDNGGA